MAPLWGTGEDRSSGTALGKDYNGGLRTSNTGPIWLRDRVHGPFYDRKVGQATPVEYNAADGPHRQKDAGDAASEPGTPVQFTISGNDDEAKMVAKGEPWASEIPDVSGAGTAELESGAGAKIALQISNERTQTTARQNGWHTEYLYLDSGGNIRVRDVHLVATSTDISTTIGTEITGLVWS
jgi:hypothetical protein